MLVPCCWRCDFLRAVSKLRFRDSHNIFCWGSLGKHRLGAPHPSGLEHLYQQENKPCTEICFPEHNWVL